MDLAASYTASQFNELVAGESDRIERKTGAGGRPIQEALVAFSNTQGGVIFIGVADDGTVTGRRLDQPTEDQIHEAAVAARNLGRYDVREVTVGDRAVVAVRVRRREEGFAQTSDGRVLVRRGARNVALYGGDLLDFVQTRALRRFESTATSLGLDDADRTYLAELGVAFGWNIDDEDLTARLREQGLLDRLGHLTIAGALFLTDPRRSLRQNKAVVEVRRFPKPGAEYDRRVVFGGPLHHQVRDATRFVVDELGTDLVVTGLYRHELPRLPEVVVREAVANAVAHRSYEHHRSPIIVEIRPDAVIAVSPGGLPEPVTVATMRQAQAARNQDVIDVLRRFRLAEDAGRGIDVIEDSMSEALLDAPRFEDDGMSVRVTLPLSGPITSRERAWVSGLEDQGLLRARDRLVLVHAARGEQVTNRMVRSLLGVSESEARAALRRLRAANLLVQHGTRGGATYAIARAVAPPAAYRLSSAELADLVVTAAAAEPLSNQAIRALTGLDRDQALRLARELVAAGRLTQRGAKRGTRYLATEISRM